jgi:MinD-like ATPase involved in chromosome partitioning or flagellar assembly
MSNEQRLKPPQLNLGNFKAPEGAVPSRPSFYSEESTMITSLSDLERERIARGSNANSAKPVQKSLPQAPPMLSKQAPAALGAAPPLQERASLKSLTEGQEVDLVELGHQDAFESTSQIDPEDLKALEEGGLFDVEPKAESQVDFQPAQAQHNPAQNNPAGLVVVFNTRGGVGATTLAVNLAGSAQAYGQHVALVDLDLQLGSVSSMLEGKALERSLAELVMEAAESPNSQIKSAIDERSGIHVIAQEGRIGEIGMVTPDRLPRFFDAVKAQHGLVIVDGVRSFSDQAVTALDAADVILLVISQDIPALRSAWQVLSLFKRLGYDRTKVKIVINRYLPKNPLTVNEIEDRLDHDVYETLDNNFPFVSSLIEQGRLARDVNIKHPVTQGFDRLASRLLGMEPPKTKGGLFSIFSRFRRS